MNHSNKSFSNKAPNSEVKYCHAPHEADKSTSTYVLSMEDVSFTYDYNRTKPAISQINLHVQCGELALLCGPSGCGKTTITRVANGLAPHFYEGTLTGKVKICSIDPSQAELWETAQYVGSVFQNPKNQFYNVDVQGEVAFGCENFGFNPNDIKKRVNKAIHDFNLEPLLDQSLFSLSGGQKQRVACASVAATKPKLIVLDEPSSNLDFLTMDYLRSAIQQWKKDGIGIIIAEHRIHYLEGLIDNVYYLQNGKITHQWTGSYFSGLDSETCKELGLRARCIKDIFTSYPTSCLYNSTRQQMSLTQERLNQTKEYLSSTKQQPNPAEKQSGQTEYQLNPIQQKQTFGTGTFYGSTDPTKDRTSQSSTESVEKHTSQCPADPAKDHISQNSFDSVIRFENFSAKHRNNGHFKETISVPYLEIPKGSITALIGSCGAGKTTFAEAILGLNNCQGDLFIESYKLDKRKRSKTCFMVMQDVNHQLFADSVIDELQIGLPANETEQKENLAILNNLDLFEFANEHPLSLSGGQRQRVAIASAIAAKRNLIVYDEPTSGLDLEHMQQAGKMMRMIQKNSVTQIVITHDLELILSCCTYIVTMENGYVINSYPLTKETLPNLTEFFLNGERTNPR